MSKENDLNYDGIGTWDNARYWKTDTGLSIREEANGKFINRATGDEIVRDSYTGRWKRA